MAQTPQPPSDKVWSIETRGIDPIPNAERHGTPFELFWIWLAANIGILGVVYGGILVASGLNLWQSALVALVGSAGSFVLVGILSVAGKWGGAPSLTLSRAPFGVRGNLGPNLVSWISLVGWETVGVVTASYAMLGLFGVLGLPTGTTWTVLALLCTTLVVVVFSLLGHATLVWLQRAITWIFGLFTIVIAGFLVTRADWAELLSALPGPWVSGVLATLSIIAAGTGIGWANAGADYARYLPHASKGRDIVLWTVVGSTIPLFFLIMVGVLVSSGPVKNLSSSPNPVEAIGEALPAWMSVPYLVTAIAGLLSAAVLSLYSSGLNLLALGLKVERYKSVLIDGVLVVSGAVFVMLIEQDFFGPFLSFLQLLAVGLAAWVAVFLVDMALRRGYDPAALIDTGPTGRYRYRGGINLGAVFAWGLGILVGLSFTSSPLFAGPLAMGVFAESSLGYFIAFLVTAVLYYLLARLGLVRLEPEPGHGRPAAESAAETRDSTGT